MSASDHHWSIGEVLSLLQDEFPEVTISKIRFLESQGLIAPERTPSGYRRFFQADFDRLQWILAQQRDHYLPLKVIRDRLESGEVDLAAPDEPSPAAAVPAAVAAVDASEAGDAGVAERTDGTDEASVDAVAPEVVDDAADRAAGESEAPVEPDDPKVAAIIANTQPVTERRGRTGTQADADANLALTLDELAEASGCAADTLADLQRFGLIAGRKVGPTTLFDGEALLLARFAGQFGAYGLDARHLRTLKIGAEREVTLLAQVIEPMLHRRDPETRARAVDTFDDLVDLAASFRAILVRQMVRAQLPSQRG